MAQMENYRAQMAGRANSSSFHQVPVGDNPRTSVAFSNSSEGEEDAPLRFGISVPGNMCLCVRDEPPRHLMENHTASRALFARQTSLAQNPSMIYSQHLRSRSRSRSGSPDPFWNSSDSAREVRGRQHTSTVHSRLFQTHSGVPGDFGPLWGPSGTCATTPLEQDSAQPAENRWNKHTATSVPIVDFRGLKGQR